MGRGAPGSCSAQRVVTRTTSDHSAWIPSLATEATRTRSWPPGTSAFTWRRRPVPEVSAVQGPLGSWGVRFSSIAYRVAPGARGQLIIASIGWLLSLVYTADTFSSAAAGDVGL